MPAREGSNMVFHKVSSRRLYVLFCLFQAWNKRNSIELESVRSRKATQVVSCLNFIAWGSLIDSLSLREIIRKEPRMKHSTHPGPNSRASLDFDVRIADAIKDSVKIGDPLGGRAEIGAAFSLPQSGDGGEIQDYGRQGHSAGKKIENIIAAGERGMHAYCFSDGMRAIAAATEIVTQPQDLVLMHRSIYGGTVRYLTRKFKGDQTVPRENHIPKFELDTIDLTSPTAADEIRTRKPRLIVGETVTNPLLDVVDMEPIMNAAKDVGAFMILDNTLSTGRACLPLEVARSVHFENLMDVLSLTKGYTAGMLSGAVVTDNEKLAKALFEIRRADGGPLPSEATPLVEAGLKSMRVRMTQLSQTTQALVEYLSNDTIPGIEVLHPFVATGRQRELAEKYLHGYPAIVTLRCALPHERFEALASALSTVFIRANSFNGVFPTMSESAKQSHASVKDAQTKAAAGVSEGLLRLSPSSLYPEDTIVERVRDGIHSWLKTVVISTGN